MDDATAITLFGGLVATVFIVLIAKNLERRRRRHVGKWSHLSLMRDTDLSDDPDSHSR
jgi:hypothetical protein